MVLVEGPFIRLSCLISTFLARIGLDEFEPGPHCGRYYNNLKAVRAITHSGDETAGKPTGIQEPKVLL